MPFDELIMLIYLLGGAALTFAALIWFLLPKTWIAWSKKAGELLPQETIPPWRSLNTLGKSLYALFVGSSILFILGLIVKTLVEHNYF